MRPLATGDGYEVELEKPATIKHKLLKVVTFLTDNLKLPGEKIGTESKAAGITAKPKAKEAGNAKTVEGHATHRQMTKKERRLAKKAKKKAARLRKQHAAQSEMLQATHHKAPVWRR